MHSVLVLGGYGNFGTPICTALSTDASIRLLIAGRDGTRARNLAAALKNTGGASVDSLEIDYRAPDFSDSLMRHRVDTLIHTAGPFQGQNHDVAERCIAAGCNYIDLADGRDFVTGIGRLDPAARARGVLVASGASSVPALSAAVIDRFLPEFSSLQQIRHGISSGAKTPGLATMQAVFGYCGKPFARLENGTWRTTWGWLDLQRHRYAAPLGGRWLGSCDVPDLALFPVRYPGVDTVTFHAGVGNPLAHLATWALAGMVRRGWLTSLTPFAAPLHRISRWIEPLGTKRSAMHVDMRGLDRNGKPLQRTWQLLAFDNHGPQIPCGAAIALARKLAAGIPVARGAMPCVGLLTLDEYLAALSHLDLRQVVQPDAVR